MPGRHISVGLLLALALMLLLLPVHWILAAVVAAAFHELCHLLCLRICGGRVTGFSFGGKGAVIDSGQLSPVNELLCTLAGPVGSLLLLFVLRIFPRIAICGAFHGAFNLLPVYPLDGGRALRCALRLLFPTHWQRIFLILQKTLLLGLTVLSLWAFFVRGLGLLPIIFLLLLWHNVKNTPCNKPRLQVQ